MKLLLLATICIGLWQTLSAEEIKQRRCSINVEFGQYDAGALRTSQESFENAQEELDDIWNLLERFSGRTEKQCNNAMIGIKLSGAHRATCLSLFSYTFNYAPIDPFVTQMEQISECLSVVQPNVKYQALEAAREAINAIEPTENRVPIDWIEQSIQIHERAKSLGIKIPKKKRFDLFTTLKVDAQKKLYEDEFGYMKRWNGPQNIRFWRPTLDILNQAFGSNFKTIAEWRKWDEAEHLKWFIGMESKYPLALDKYPSIFKETGYMPTDISAFLRRHEEAHESSLRILVLLSQIEGAHDSEQLAKVYEDITASPYEKCLTQGVSSNEYICKRDMGIASRELTDGEDDKNNSPSIMCFIMCIEMDEKWTDIFISFMLVFVIYYFCKNTFLYKKKPLKLKD